jgi:hypothetical protein
MTTTLNPFHRIIPAVPFSQVVPIAGDFTDARKKTPEDPRRRSLFHIVSDKCCRRRLRDWLEHRRRSAKLQ